MTYWRVDTMTKTQMIKVPHLEYWETVPEFNSFCVLVHRWKHDSGYRRMSYVLCQNWIVVWRIPEGSDVLQLYSLMRNLEGSTKVFQLPKIWQKAEPPKILGEMPEWIVDALPKSGVLHFRNGIGLAKQLSAGSFLSSQEIY